MKPTFAQRLDLWARRLIPVVMTLLLLLLGAVPLGVPYLGSVTPAYTLMAVFYWAVYRPDLLPLGMVFVIGVLEDALSGLPLGVGALALLFVYGTALGQRRTFLKRPFYIAWIGFAILAAMAALLVWLLIAVLNGSMIGIQPAMFQYAITVALFPCLAILFVAAHRHIQR